MMMTPISKRDCIARRQRAAPGAPLKAAAPPASAPAAAVIVERAEDERAEAARDDQVKAAAAADEAAEAAAAAAAVALEAAGDAQASAGDVHIHRVRDRSDGAGLCAVDIIIGAVAGLE